MSDRQVEWTQEELLADHPIEAPLVAGGRVCHGGFDSDGDYVSPRTRHRNTAIDSWQRAHRESFGAELLDVPLATWPESYPNVAQAKFLLAEGVREPIITLLTRIGTVEGFGAMIRYAALDDPQQFFDESIVSTAISHLHHGLFEAHARDEAGWEEQAGHKEMWYAARDVAFEEPVSDDQTAEMLKRLGLASGGPAPDPVKIREQMLAARMFPDIDLELETLIQRMTNILLIEISAFHVFSWAETVLADAELVAGDGEAAQLVSYIRQDETPHVEYLKTALTEMRDRTFLGESGRSYPGTEVVGRLWDRGLDESLGIRREQNLRVTLAEVERAVDDERRGADLLEEFHSLGSIRPDSTGAFVAA